MRVGQVLERGWSSGQLDVRRLQGRDVLGSGRGWLELGVLGVSVLLALSGWRITYLGPNLPASELQKTGRTLKPDWVCTSIVVPVPPRDLEAYIGIVREALPKRTWMAVGGAGTRGYDRPIPARVLVSEHWRELMHEPR